MPLTRTQVDLLGDRLRAGSRSPGDLEALATYRRSFRPAFDVVTTMVSSVGVTPSGRPAKTTEAIVAKLLRGNFRLSRIHDIAGCRIVVENLALQDEVVARIVALFGESRIVDRRATPSHGYRAVHVIVRIYERPVEVQVRTAMQHDWAQFSEKLADRLGIDVKYGGGSDEVRDRLAWMSAIIAGQETSAALELVDRQTLERSHAAVLELMGDFVDAVERGRVR